jgi:hypothetical protein
MASPLHALAHTRTHPWFVVQKKKKKRTFVQVLIFFFFFFHQLLCLITHNRLRLTVYGGTYGTYCVMCGLSFRPRRRVAFSRHYFLDYFIRLRGSVINRLRRLRSGRSRLPCCQMMYYAPEIDVLSDTKRTYLCTPYVCLLRMSTAFRRRPSTIDGISVSRDPIVSY